MLLICNISFCVNSYAQNLSSIFYYNVDDYISITNDSISPSYKEFAQGVYLSKCGQYKESKQRFQNAMNLHNYFAANNYAVINCIDGSFELPEDSIVSILTECSHHNIERSSTVLNRIHPRHEKVETEADNGNIVSQTRKGRFYEHHNNYDSSLFSYKRAIRTLLKGSELSDEIQLTDKGKEYNWFTDFSSVDIKHADANLKGLYFYIKGDKLKGKHLLEKSCKQGNRETVKNLAVILQLEQKYEEAIKLIKDYTLDTDPEFQLYIGDIIHDGQCYPLSSMIPYYEKSAEQGNDVARYNMAVCYLKGLCVNRDSLKAQRYLQEIKQDTCGSYLLLDKIKYPEIEVVSDTQVVKSREYKAICLFNKGNYASAIRAFQEILSNDKTNMYANYYLSQVYESGCGVPQDKRKAIEYITSIQFIRALPLWWR